MKRMTTINNNQNNNILLEDSIFRVGIVIFIEGRAVKIKVDRRKNTSHLLYKGDLIKNISVGSYIKIIKGFTKIIGKIEGEYIEEDRSSSNKEYKSEREKINRILNVKLLGFFSAKGFERGIKELPLIDNECFILQKDEFEKVHRFIKDGEDYITVGSLSFEKGQDINVGINTFFASHIGIFGNTGSGKSYTLAKIYRELFKKYKVRENFRNNSQFFLIDFNGEYIKEDAIIESKSEKYIWKERFDLSTRTREGREKFPITRKNINDPIFWSIFLTATEKTQVPFLKRTLSKEDIKDFQINDIIKNIITNEDRKIDKGVIFNFINDVEHFLKNRINIGILRNNLKYHSINGTYYISENGNDIYANSNSEEVISKIKEILNGTNGDLVLREDITEFEKIHLKIIYHYYNDIVSGFSNQEHLAPLIKRLDKRINDLEKVVAIKDDSLSSFFVIVSLKDVNNEMKKILPLLICKQLYDDKKEKNEKEKSLHFIIDEAHNILSHSSERESEAWKDYRLETFEEIIKEGRKFGVFLTIASQRPADISTTIISQLHNYFLHRLINHNDILAVEKTISYLDKVSFDYLPILPTGTCILAGLFAQVPVVIDIGSIKPKEYAPDNETIVLTDNW